jgi:hypothetical protein
VKTDHYIVAVNGIVNSLLTGPYGIHQDGMSQSEQAEEKDGAQTRQTNSILNKKGPIAT